MDTIKGIVSKISFQNKETGFTVLQLQIPDSFQPVTCVGLLPTVTNGESVSLEGIWDTHPRFGRQFSVVSCKTLPPDSTDGIIKLLSSGLIASIGPVRSNAIVEKFGMSTLHILDASPEKLIEIPGIGKKTLEKITRDWKKHHHIRNLTLFLQEFDISLNLIYKISKIYGIDAQQKILENPFSLIDNIRGIGFIKADKIAQKMGYEHNSFKRIRAGIIFVLQEALNEGNVCLPKSLLIQKAIALLNVPEEQVVFSLDSLLETQSLYSDCEFLYLSYYYFAERFVAKNIKNRISFFNDHPINGFSENDLQKWINDYQSSTGWTGDPLQIEAIVTALQKPLFLLTGGPGTGKTTILRVMTTLFAQKNYRVTLAAPTGRAAERISNITGLAAKTIHRLLEFRPGSVNITFQKNEKNPLETDVLIIDEFSMVDLQLFNHLLCATPLECHIILIGDHNQLPSVGAGNLLYDLIISNQISHIHLSSIFRQSSSSRIVTIAHEIIKGTIPSFFNRSNDDCFFISKDDPQECVDCIVDLVTRRLPNRYGFNPIHDIQVISPMHKGLLGTHHLNTTLQNALTKQEKRIEKGSMAFYPGDKVMQMKNNYENGIFNGDIGTVSEIIDDSSLIVNYNGISVEYTVFTLEEIQPAYCISIHKSQGSEYKGVIIPMSTQHYLLLQRNLLYTALTRAKRICILIGTKNALTIAIQNNRALQRYSHLATLLSGDLSD